MQGDEPKGCLMALLRLLGVSFRADGVRTGRDNERLPYRRRDDFLSPAELSFYRVLVGSLSGKATVCCKVNLLDVFFVAGAKTQQYRNKVDRKHVDFLLCDPLTMQPRCAIELDDSSHARTDRQTRDEFVDQVFSAVGLPLIRVAARASYNAAEILTRVAPHLHAGDSAKLGPQVIPGIGPPVCPKCGAPMVQRVAKQGPNAGEASFGCPNFPKCRITA